VVEASNTAASQTAAITQELKKQMDKVSQAVNATGSQIASVEKKLSGIDQNKIDKQTMDLAIKFEVLKIENALKSRIDALQSRLNELEGGAGRRSSGAAPSSQSSSGRPSASKPTTQAPAQAPAPDKPAPSSDSDIEEQNLQ
jgi:hypothetical protein